jgi:hypothetical protein
MSALVSAIITFAGLWFYHHYFSVQLATMDMSAYADQLRDDYIQGHLTKQELDEKLKALSQRLKIDYKNTIVLVKGAVISGKIQEINPGK